MYEAFDDPEVEVVLNLTRPYEHYEVTKQALLHGKHTYSEKPLAVDMEECRGAHRPGRGEMTCAWAARPDHLFRGRHPDRPAAHRRRLHRGTWWAPPAPMVCHGHRDLAPPTRSSTTSGAAAPMLDMGPYYVTALVQLLGEAKGVMGFTKKTFPHRTITSQPHYGEDITVDVDTYPLREHPVSNGAIAQLFTTFDVYYTQQARFEVYGTKGSLVVPDPNTFGGPVLLLRPEDQSAGPKTDPRPWTKRPPPSSTTATRRSPCSTTTTRTAGPWAWRTCARPCALGREHRAKLPAAAPCAGDHDQLLQIQREGRHGRAHLPLHPHRPHGEQPHARHLG